jgi:hypothetical protein
MEPEPGERPIQATSSPGAVTSLGRWPTNESCIELGGAPRTRQHLRSKLAEAPPCSRASSDPICGPLCRGPLGMSLPHSLSRADRFAWGPSTISLCSPPAQAKENTADLRARLGVREAGSDRRKRASTHLSGRLRGIGMPALHRAPRQVRSCRRRLRKERPPCGGDCADRAHQRHSRNGRVGRRLPRFHTRGRSRVPGRQAIGHGADVDRDSCSGQFGAGSMDGRYRLLEAWRLKCVESLMRPVQSRR